LGIELLPYFIKYGGIGYIPYLAGLATMYSACIIRCDVRQAFVKLLSVQSLPILQTYSSSPPLSPSPFSGAIVVVVVVVLGQVHDAVCVAARVGELLSPPDSS
jgi:hypothetical protein